MNSFREYLKNEESLNEDVSIVNGVLVFDAEPGTGIKTSFGKGKQLKPFTKRVSADIMSYSLYSANTKNNTEILQAMKNANWNDPGVKAFINRSAIYAARIIRQLKIDIIVSPRSSSDLNKELSYKISEKTGNDVHIDAFQKTADLSKVYVDRDHPKITPELIDSLEKTLERGRRRGYITVSLFHPSHRQFIAGLFEATDMQLMNKVEGKNVLIVDDIMTSGTTAQNIGKIIMEHGASSCSVLTMFKN